MECRKIHRPSQNYPLRVGFVTISKLRNECDELARFRHKSDSFFERPEMLRKNKEPLQRKEKGKRYLGYEVLNNLR